MTNYRNNEELGEDIDIIQVRLQVLIGIVDSVKKKQRELDENIVKLTKHQISLSNLVTKSE